MKIELAKTEVIHFVGIGGIGMSGLSLIMKGKGFNVQGSDLNSNKNIERLKKEKIKIFFGQRKKNLKINCVSPGGIEDNLPKRFVKNYKKQCNIKGLLDPKDVVDAINFLLSEKSNFISGQNIVVDDGYSL